ncbi:M20/M25/M40 family metallo-hydrolase [Herminiimonas sp. NPDC097707]|uniref:M20/M25/M40 family metallo-hydrolase n=1 Tax=Herminiimonas sp. NPDC097707 TaxID=3364007 RepID=UPI00383A36DC
MASVLPSSTINHTELDKCSAIVAQLAKHLVSVPSHYPPGDTHLMADAIVQAIADVPNIEVERYPTLPHVVNLVLRVRGDSEGRRLVFNGHMDTFPLVNEQAWTTNPKGEEKNGRLYGLGISDMKGGIAAILMAMRFLAKNTHLFSGEVVATFVGDEESMGTEGTKWLLENVEHARGDAMISADAGSPYVLRFGEKGILWLNLSAKGKSAHAAHVHHGDSAIDKLLDVIADLKALCGQAVNAPESVTSAIDASRELSESYSGAGETEVLKNLTMTVGTIQGGRLSNLISDSAEATADIRVPVGVKTSDIEANVHKIIEQHPGVSVVIRRSYEPSWTDVNHPIIQSLVKNCESVLGKRPVVNMRVGASDARHYRYVGIPTVVCGLTSYNMGAADEHVDTKELDALVRVFAMTAIEFLKPN